MFIPKSSCGQCYGTGIVQMMSNYLIGRSQPGQPCKQCEAYEKLNNEKTGDGMLNAEKLSKLLKEIFTRDNGNFSPELVAEELTRRENDFMVKPAVYRYAYYDTASGQQQFKVESDQREMRCPDTPPCDAVGLKAEGVDRCYGVPYVHPCDVDVKAVAVSEVAKWLDSAQQEPSLNDREKFHSEAVEWLAEQYHEWPARKRDWVFVNQYSTGEWFIANGITLSSGCVVYRSEWADMVNKTRPPKKCVVIGNGCTSNHKYAVVIGSNVSSDKDYQLKIGSNDIQCSRDISQEEFDEIRKVFATLIGK